MATIDDLIAMMKQQGAELKNVMESTSTSLGSEITSLQTRMSRIQDDVGATVDSRFKPLADALLQRVDDRLNALRTPSSFSEEKEKEEPERRAFVDRGKQHVGASGTKPDGNTPRTTNTVTPPVGYITERQKHDYYEGLESEEEQYERRRRRRSRRST